MGEGNKKRRIQSSKRKGRHTSAIVVIYFRSDAWISMKIGHIKVFLSVYFLEQLKTALFKSSDNWIKLCG